MAIPDSGAARRQRVPSLRPLRRVLGAAGLGALLPLTPTALAAQCGELVLPEDSLDSTLLRVGREADVSILFRRENVEPHRSAAVSGEDDCMRLLQSLLQGTGLGVRHVGADVYVVRPLPQQAAVQEVQVPAGAQRVEAPGALALEEVVVRGRGATGSRVRDMRLDGSAQIDVIDRYEIERSGYQSLSEILRFLPAVAGNAASTYVTNGGDGTANVTLRGLPATHTLVLLNGRRMNTDALSGQAVDLNTLPLAAIERIEVLKDGASAIYGSDAIAGVVNVITRDGVDGLHISSYGGIASRRDLETQHHSILFGHQGARSSVLVGAEFYDQRDIASRDRDISRSADDRARGGLDKRSSATAPARVLVGDESLVLSEGGAGTTPGSFRAATDEDKFDFRAFTTALVPSRRYSGFAELEWDLEDGTTLYAELLHSRTDSTAQLAPVPLFTGFESIELTVAEDAAFNPFGVALNDVRRRFVELPAREQRNRTETDRWVVGVKSAGARWDVDLHAAQHRTRSRESLANLLFGPALQASLGPAAVCAADPACRPLNLFGGAGTIDPEVLDFVRTDARANGDSELLTVAVDGVVDLADLPAGMVRFASGAQWRRESLSIDPDPRAAARLLVGGLNYGATDGDRTVSEVHAEMLIPLLSNRLGAQQLDLQLADRWSHYSDFGFTHNPKAVLRWRPLTSVLLRASWSAGFRAPTLRELYLSTQQSAAFLVDPCARPDSVGRLPGCRVVSDPTLNQFLTVLGGNPSLNAEQAHSQTLGIVWAVPGVPGQASLSVDVYDIEQENVVDASAQFIVDENAARGRFPDRIRRDALGNLQSVTATNLNIGRREVAGADLAVNWRLPPSRYGLLELAVKASHIHRFEDQLDPGSGTIERAGTFQDAASEGNGALPDWKLNMGLTWTLGPWETRYGLHHVTGLREQIPLIGTSRTIGAWTRQNVQLGYRWREQLDGSVALGVQNIADAAPPFAASAFNDSFDSRTHDLIGRFVYTRLTLSL